MIYLFVLYNFTGTLSISPNFNYLKCSDLNFGFNYPILLNLFQFLISILQIPVHRMRYCLYVIIYHMRLSHQSIVEASVGRGEYQSCSGENRWSFINFHPNTKSLKNEVLQALLRNNTMQLDHKIKLNAQLVSIHCFTTRSNPITKPS